MENTLIDDFLSGFAKRLIFAMRYRKITPTELSRRTGISRPAISHYTHGYRAPEAAYLVRICKALDVSADALLGLKG